jgi:cell division protein FtsI (penicillin-binding protein 3)
MGQEIGVSPLQLISMVSTIANDGVYVPARVIMGTTPPRSTPQLIDFHPALGRRVLSPMTAAEMKRMMEGVVLEGTGTRAILNGYSTAGKTGTAQKIDPATGTYSRSRYIASFTGFAPVNNPALTVLVVLDSPVGQHEGGQVSAPVFARVAQQVLAYWNVPHDVEVQDAKIFSLRAKAKEKDVTESSPDRIPVDAEQMPLPPAPQPGAAQAAKPDTKTVAAANLCSTAAGDCKSSCGTGALACGSSPASSPSPASSNSTVVLDVAGGVEVPDFSGKPLRSALEEAEEAGIELEVSGSGVAQTQSPPAGSHIAHGGHVSVRFGR